MTTSVAAHTHVDERRAWRGLLWLAVANVAGTTIVAAIGLLLAILDPIGMGFVRFSFATASSGVIHAQALAWVIAAALIPCRRFAGLLSSLAFSIVLGTILWLRHAAEQTGSAIESLPTVWAYCMFLSVFAIAQGLRFLLGWRLALPSDASQVQRVQFGIADLIEWTLSIGVFLGVGQLSGWFVNLAQLALFVTSQTLASMPVALSVVSRGRPRLVFVIIAIGVTVLAMAGYEYANAYVVGIPLSYARNWVMILILALSYVTILAMNFVIIRRLGFSFTTPVKHAAPVKE